MGMFLQKVDDIKTKSGSSFKNFAAEVTKLGAGDEIRRFDGILQQRLYSLPVVSDYANILSAFSPTTFKIFPRTLTIRLLSEEYGTRKQIRTLKKF